jgi:endonuclease I
MVEPIADRHKADNEAIFRELNQSLQKGVDEANAIAAEEGQEPLDFDPDAPLHFFCECADENCQARILLSPNTYNEIHNDNRNFTIKPGHQVPKIEDVVTKEHEYWIVTKHEEPPQLSDTLHPTDVHNI